MALQQNMLYRKHSKCAAWKYIVVNGRCVSGFRSRVRKHMTQNSSLVIRCEIVLRGRQRTAQRSSQCWFSKYIGIVRQYVITWANGGPDLCRHMASLSHHVLNLKRYKRFIIEQFKHQSSLFVRLMLSSTNLCRIHPGDRTCNIALD